MGLLSITQAVYGHIDDTQIDIEQIEERRERLAEQVKFNDEAYVRSLAKLADLRAAVNYLIDAKRHN